MIFLIVALLLLAGCQLILAVDKSKRKPDRLIAWAMFAGLMAQVTTGIGIYLGVLPL